jgi:hypothetical protein
MKKQFGIFATLLGLLLFLTTTAPAFADAPAAAAVDPDLAPAEAIKGEISMTFNTRTAAGTDDGAPKKGVKDAYAVNLTINGNRQVSGQITRQPRIKRLIQTVQQPQYDFDLKWIALIKDSGPRTVGNWVGVMPLDLKTGAYTLDGGGDSKRALRIMVDVGQAFTDEFGGRFYGKPEDKTKLSWESFKRTINGKVVEYKYQADPMRFDGTILAEGPDKGRYTRCVVTGNLDYDRATGNYITNQLKMSYNLGGAEQHDTISGTIKWVEDPQRASNGKGRYEFNIRFNEDKATKPLPEDQIAKVADEDAIFSVAPGIPSLTGTIEYVDTFAGSVVKDPDGKPLPTASKSTYNLKAEKMKKQQVMNFLKLWLLAVGPTNDE